jgi:hypothetical protein
VAGAGITFRGAGAVVAVCAFAVGWPGMDNGGIAFRCAGAVTAADPAISRSSAILGIECDIENYAVAILAPWR